MFRYTFYITNITKTILGSATLICFEILVMPIFDFLGY